MFGIHVDVKVLFYAELIAGGAKRQVRVLLHDAANRKVKVMRCESSSCTYAFIEL